MGFFVDGEESDTLGLGPSKEESQSYLELGDCRFRCVTVRVWRN